MVELVENVFRDRKKSRWWVCSWYQV